MPVSIVVGAQWGDEGKGKVVDALAAGADLCVRYAGGANAGHTIVVGGSRIVLHVVPAGILHPGCHNVIGGGCVVDPEALVAELDALGAAGGGAVCSRLTIAEQAHVVTPYHLAVDRAEGGRIGTTGRGIGPAYADKARRIGVRMADLRDGTFAQPLALVREACARWLGGDATLPPADEVSCRLAAAGARLRGLIADPTDALVAARRSDSRVILEGAQGALLDVDHGTWPFVTSSNTTAAGALGGLGVHLDLRRRIGVVKAYATRVGHGPFPTELAGDAGDALRERGREYGATTGRPRRCGWLDLPALQRVFACGALTHFALTKLDVLAAMGPFSVAVGHGPQGPELRTFEGFDGDLSRARAKGDLPPSARALIDLLARALGAAPLAISTGPARDQAIWLEEPW